MSTEVKEHSNKILEFLMNSKKQVKVNDPIFQPQPQPTIEVKQEEKPDALDLLFDNCGKETVPLKPKTQSSDPLDRVFDEWVS